MPVEIREVIIRAELSNRPLTPSPDTSQQLTPEMISMIQSICEHEFREIREKLPNHAKQGKFER